MEVDAEVGVFAHKLPMAVGITPAVMPQAVLDWELGEGRKGSKRQAIVHPEGLPRKRQGGEAQPSRPIVSSGHPSRKEDIPSSGFSTRHDQRKKLWFLSNPSLKFEVPVQCKGQLYQDPEGNDVWWAGGDTDPQFCQDLAYHYAAPLRPINPASAPGSLAISAMRGMHPGAVAAPDLQSLARLPAGDSTHS